MWNLCQPRPLARPLGLVEAGGCTATSSRSPSLGFRVKNEPRLETGLPELRADLRRVYKEMDVAGAEWLELRPDSERNRAKRQKVEERTNDLIDESRRLEKKIHAAEKRLR